MTQHDLILKHMRFRGSITTYEAYEEYGITKLTTRISELRRAGFDIRSQTISEKNRFGKLVTYNRYWLENDRDCENCTHLIDGWCEEWECEFEPKEATDEHS